MVDNARLAGRLFDFTPAATIKVNDPAQNTATTWRRTYGGEGAPLDCTDDLCLPTLVRAASSFTSPLQQWHGLTHVAFAVTSTQGGSVVLNKYLDPLGLIAAGSATAAMTANSALLLDHSSTSLLQSWAVTINNTSASTATLSSAIGLLSK
jgi:hypothetical protein